MDTIVKLALNKNTTKNQSNTQKKMVFNDFGGGPDMIDLNDFLSESDIKDIEKELL